MSLPRYSEYKPSGVEWLGEVPGHWDSTGLRWLSTRYSGGTPDKTNLDYWADGTIPWLNSGEVNQSLVTEPSTYITEDAFQNSSAKWIPQGALVMALAGQGKTKGMVAQLGIPATCNQSMAAIIPTQEQDARFLFWWLTSNYQNIRNMAGGDLRDGLNLELLGNIPCPLAPITEQQTIAAFLDSETGKIDALIAEQRRLVELLAEKRQAVISHAVTKGISRLRHSGHDPESSNQTIPRSGQSGCPAAQESSNQLDSGLRRNDGVVMKDSGIEWLGEVPEHWDVRKIKHLATRIASGKTPLGGSEIYVDEGVMFLRSQNVYDEGLRLEDVAYISEAIDEVMSVSSVRPNDILLNVTGASIGRSCVVPPEFPAANVNQHVCVIRLRTLAQVPFVGLFFKSMPVKNQIDHAQNGAAREGLNFDQIGNMSIAMPPSNEQKSIAAFLDTETAKLDTLTAEANRAIALLQERRSALISAAVTGKIDVRCVVIPA